MKDEPIDWEETIDPSESLTIDHEIDIKPVGKTSNNESDPIVNVAKIKRAITSPSILPCRKSYTVRMRTQTWRKKSIHR